jgi:hypothetical protein
MPRHRRPRKLASVRILADEAWRRGGLRRLVPCSIPGRVHFRKKGVSSKGHVRCLSAHRLYTADYDPFGPSGAAGSEGMKLFEECSELSVGAWARRLTNRTGGPPAKAGQGDVGARGAQGRQGRLRHLGTLSLS